MKKLLLIPLLALTGACASTAAEPSRTATIQAPTTVTTSAPTTTTTTDSRASDCIERGEGFSEDWFAVAGMSYDTPAQADRLLTAARTLVDDGRDWLDDCGSYAPTEAAVLTDLFDQMENMIDLAEQYS